ncbi:MAG: signal peptidase II [Rhizobiales bacterium 65-9]|nr:signal peptidase II [Hyphomicrobiales bacterium]OJY38103.1 MAG: signal peptidase II [Rhizobiales bacterium 65-9]
MTPARLGAAIAAVILVADQATKLWALFVRRIVETGPVQVTSFLELTEVWNRGISYGLFQQHTEWGRWLLIAVSAVAAVGFSIWLARARDRALAIALGLLIGGAVGNLIDRVAYGAVFDFIHFYWGRFSWYVFNIADAAIVAGVIGLLYDAVRSRGGVQGTEGG